tara:strand:- start:951 stop:1376 length:426 start_codon:yes stop_codon:yes gene_type:complete
MSYSKNNWERKINFAGYKMYLNSMQADIVMKNFNLFEEKSSALQRLVTTYNNELGYNNSSIHLYRIEVQNNEEFISKMRDRGIVCGKHYDAMHKNLTYTRGTLFKCPRSEKIEKTTVSLPMNEVLTPIEIEHIIKSTKELM